MKDRDGLANEIKDKVQRNLFERQWVSKICGKLFDEHNIPYELTSDLLTLKTDTNDALDSVLYYVSKEIGVDVNKYFTPNEVEMFGGFTYEMPEVNFPYVFENMVEVESGKQYIGKFTAQQLMLLRDAQIINYNPNTQRQMQLKTGNNFSYYRIALNRKAVTEIMKLMKSGDYISNTITLNINPATDFNYSDGDLKIRESVKFDILDGYHRYIAMSNLYNEDHAFDYPMELRVVFFREEMARQFIFQEDQKTKLAKVDSAAMNKNDVGNKICKELLEMIRDTFNVTNIIRQGVLLKMISVLYIQKDRIYNYGMINAIATQIFKDIKLVALEVPDLMNTQWHDNFTISFLIIAKSGKAKGKELYDRATELADEISLTEYNIGALSINKLNKILLKKGGDDYVVQ